MKTLKNNVLILWIASITVAAVGCDDKESSDPQEDSTWADSQTDFYDTGDDDRSHGNSDAYTDGDADADTDADSDTDADADTDTDTDADGDGDTDREEEFGDPDPLIDNMDDCNNAIHAADGRGGYWYSYNSTCDGLPGTQFPEAAECGEIAPPFPMEDEGGNCRALTSGSGFPHTDPDYGYAGIGFTLTPSRQSYDVCRYSGVSFSLVGSPVRFKAVTVSTDTDHDNFGKVVQPGSISVAWGELTQEGWGIPQSFDCSEVIEFQFQAIDPADFEFSVDDITFTTD